MRLMPNFDLPLCTSLMLALTLWVWLSVIVLLNFSAWLLFLNERRTKRNGRVWSEVASLRGGLASKNVLAGFVRGVYYFSRSFSIDRGGVVPWIMIPPWLNNLAVMVITTYLPKKTKQKRSSCTKPTLAFSKAVVLAKSKSETPFLSSFLPDFVKGGN